MEDYIKKVEQDHIDHWFKDHKAILTNSGDVKILDWSNGTFAHHITYLFYGQYVHVQGDCGSAVFRLSELAVPEKVSNYNLSYFLGKMECMQFDKYKFNEEKCLKELREWKHDMLADNEVTSGVIDCYDDLVYAAQQYGTLEGWEHGVWSIYDSASYANFEFDSEDASHFAEFGKELSPHAIIYLLGIKLAMAQLKEKKDVKEMD